MKNKSTSDFVAATMDAVLKSEAHKSLFGTNYKFAEVMCDQCHKMHEHGSCDSDNSSAHDFNYDSTDEDTSNASDGSTDDEADTARDDEADTAKDDTANADDMDEEMSSSAFDVAIDSLLTASAALDTLNLQRGSVLSLKLASLVVEAKKKDTKDKKTSKDSKDSNKNKKDSKDTKKSDTKKSDSNAAKDKGKKKDPKSSNSKPSSPSSNKKFPFNKKPPFGKKK